MYLPEDIPPEHPLAVWIQLLQVWNHVPVSVDVGDRVAIFAALNDVVTDPHRCVEGPWSLVRVHVPVEEREFPL